METQRSRRLVGGAVAATILVLGAASASAQVARAGLSSAPNRVMSPGDASPKRAFSARELSGRVLVSKVLLAPEAAENPALIPAPLRVERPVVAQSLGFWRLHLLAFFERPVTGDVVTLVAHDVTDSSTSPGARREVKTFEIPIEPGSRTLQLNDFVVVESMGFTAGHTYELSVVPDRGAETDVPDTGKSDVFAQGVVTLR